MRYSAVLFTLFIVAVLVQREACADMGPTQAELDAGGESVDWLLPNHDYAGQRFVDLKQIGRENAAQLSLFAFTRRGMCADFSRIRSSTKG